MQVHHGMTALSVILTMFLVRIPVLPPAQRFYHSDLADRSVKFWTVPTIARRAVLGRDAKIGTDARIPSVPIFAYGIQLAAKNGSFTRDPVQ